MTLSPPIPNDLSDRVRDSERLCVSPPILDYFMVLHHVTDATGKSKSGIYEGIRAGTFPAPVRISKGRVAWLASEILAWQCECIEARRLEVAANAISGQNKQEKGPTAKELYGPKLSVTTPVIVHASKSDVQRPRVLSKGSNGHESTGQTR